jgi:hypothetical protein
MRVLGVVLAGLVVLLFYTAFGATTTFRAPEGFTVQVPVTLTPEKPEKGFTHDGYPYDSILYSGGDYLIEVADYSFLPDETDLRAVANVAATSINGTATDVQSTTVSGQTAIRETITLPDRTFYYLVVLKGSKIFQFMYVGTGDPSSFFKSISIE